MTFILENSYQLLLIMGLIFVLVGSIQYTFPPKKINRLCGYRTVASMKNQKQWDFAQQFSSVRLMQIGDSNDFNLVFLKRFLSQKMKC